MTNVSNLTASEMSTIRLGLYAWSSRCEDRAKSMEVWLHDELFTDDETRAKCLASVADWRRFRSEADELLAVLSS